MVERGLHFLASRSRRAPATFGSSTFSASAFALLQRLRLRIADDRLVLADTSRVGLLRAVFASSARFRFHVALMICFCSSASFVACAACRRRRCRRRPRSRRRADRFPRTGRTSAKNMSVAVRRGLPSGPMSSAQRNHETSSSGFTPSSSSLSRCASVALLVGLASRWPSSTSCVAAPATLTVSP